MPDKNPAPTRLAAGGLSRHFARRGGTWVTIRVAHGARSVPIDGDEFAVRLASGILLTAHDYACPGPVAQPESLAFEFSPRPDRPLPKEAPIAVRVLHRVSPATAPGGAGFLTKSVHFTFPPGAPAPASVEVERFRTPVAADRGGRGEPVVLGRIVALVPTNPTLQTRHTDGNTPAPYSHRFERVGNHSVVELEGGDREPRPAAGLVRCVHFPLFPRDAPPAAHRILEGQTVDWIAIPPGASPETTVIEHVRPPTRARAFTHYNNWFDPDGKDLRGDALPRVLAAFQKRLVGTGIALDAMVPDNGWQDRRSVWQPDPAQFPAGMVSLARLGARLRAGGSALGLWIAVDNTTNDIDWGQRAGYERARPNAYFSQYFPHHVLAQPAYRDAATRQLDALAEAGGLRYVKCDFNHLSHTDPTDRHGHEAEFAGFVHATAPLRRRGIFLNATNWTWHSPAWLHHADTVWMLAGDDGFNANCPELAGRAQATTDRDTYFHRMWGDPADRPWFPISAIMTHGIIRNAGGQMSFPTDTLRDWADHVAMHYGRGTLLREWYLSPAHVTADEWSALVAVHQWADARREDLIETTFVGGRPDEGKAYGYVGWGGGGRSGTVVARNPGPGPVRLTVPLDETTRYRGRRGAHWHAVLRYPREEVLPGTIRGGATLELNLAGYETIAVEVRPGPSPARVVATAPPPARVEAAGNRRTIVLDGRRAAACELQVIGYPTLPRVWIDGVPANPRRTSKGSINTFASYARDGMDSTVARPWEMAGFDVSLRRDRPFTVTLEGGDDPTAAEAWLQVDEAAAGSIRGVAGPSPRTIEAMRRWSVPVFAEQAVAAAPEMVDRLGEREAAEARSAVLMLETFGVNEGFADKRVTFSGVDLGVLPAGGDAWRRVEFTLPKGIPPLGGVLEVSTRDDGDKFKVRRATVEVELADGRRVHARDRSTWTSHRDWPYFEGRAFEPAQGGRLAAVFRVAFPKS